MRLRGLLAGLFVLSMAALGTPAWAGETLVIKSSEGKFIPAAASEWAKVSDGTFRFVLKTGLSAPKVAAELKEQIAPIAVEAPDELTLVFKAAKLDEQALLSKLASLELGGDKVVGDALAALSDLGSAGAPTVGDMSSAGSIRASKEIELPDADARKRSPAKLVGRVIGFEPCKPLPVFHIQITEIPSAGKYKDAFKKGQKIAVRGYYKVDDGSKKLDSEDARTAINLANQKFPLGKKIFGQPFLEDGDVWILETIEAL